MHRGGYDGSLCREPSFESAADSFGPIDILINNAGRAQSAPLQRTSEELWQSLIAVNLTGVYHGIRAVLPAMMERKFGRIVSIASTAGLRGYPYVAAYCASKHGVIGLRARSRSRSPSATSP